MSSVGESQGVGYHLRFLIGSDMVRPEATFLEFVSELEDARPDLCWAPAFCENGYYTQWPGFFRVLV